MAAIRIRGDNAGELGTCPGAEARTCWLLFEIAGGRHLVVVGVYVPPDYRTNPTQEEVLEAVRKFLNGLPGRCLKLVTGDWNAQLLRNRDGQTGRWCLRNDIHKLNSAAKRKSPERLHSFLQETRMFAVSTHLSLIHI